MRKFLRPGYEDEVRYKQLWPELHDKSIEPLNSQAYLNADDLYALEHLLGRNVNEEDFGEDGALADTGILRKLNALKARRAYAEYLMRMRSFNDDMNDHWNKIDANTLALLSFDPEGTIDDYVQPYEGDKYKKLLSDIVNEVPDEMFSDSDAGRVTTNRRDKAREAAQNAGVTYEDEYGDEVKDGIKYGKYTKYNAQQLYDSLHPFSAPDEPLLTDEERSTITDALKDLKY